MTSNKTRRISFLDVVEWAGNKLPEPATLFIAVAIIVMILSHVGSLMGWSVQPLRPKLQALVDEHGRTILDDAGQPRLMAVIHERTGRPMLEAHGEPIRPVSLLTKDGAYWAISSLVGNFVDFPPLGIVLTAMLGVGVAERTGLIRAVLKALARAIPAPLLTPAIIFLGVNSSLTSDAGYVVLPPAAAALFMAAGRAPLAGIAAATGGVAAGFSANLLITASDAMMAGFTETASRFIDTDYTVSATCNWYFMIASTLMLPFVGWMVTAWIIEPRFRSKPAHEGGPAELQPADIEAQRLRPEEIRGLAIASAVFAVVLALTLAAIFHERGPLHGLAPNSTRERWSQSIVPIIFISFLIPGMAYGMVVGKVRREKDVTELLIDSMRSMAGVIVVYFFAAQFIEYFKHSNLGRMVSMVGGQWLATTELSTGTLLASFVVLVTITNLLMSSMSAKYAVMSPIFVPMLMLLGVSPELTQAAYRVGDSVTNNFAPLNPYQVIILKEMQKHAPNAGMGTLISANIPYSIFFGVFWIGLLLVWMNLGLPLGPGGPLHYLPATG